MFDFNCLFVMNSLPTLALVLNMSDYLTRNRKSLILNNLAMLISFRFRLKHNHANSDDNNDKENDTTTIIKMTILLVVPMPLKKNTLILIATITKKKTQ